MCLYVLSSVLLISLVFFVFSCYVSLCSEFLVVHFFSLFCVVLLCIFMFWVPCCNLRYDIRIQTMFCSSLPLVVVGFISYLRYLRESVCGFLCKPLFIFCPFSFHHCLSSTKHSLWLLLWSLGTFLGQKQEFWQLWRILLMITNKPNYAISYKW